MHCRNATVAALAFRASILSLVLFLPVVAAGQLYTFTHFAGPDGGPDWIDATGTNARFSNPHGVVQDSAGNLYVADASNHCIRKITPAGVVTTFAGMPGVGGSADGAGGSARFSNPEQLAIDPSGNIYVADRGNELIRRITPSGVVTRFAGTAGMAGTVNGSALSAQFDWPTGIAISPAGDIYVSDYRSHVIRKISGGVVSTFAGVPGESGATASPARFNHPRDLAVDSSGNVFVADTGNYTIRRITPAGSVSTFAGTPAMPGDDDGTGVAARFLQPDGVATDPSDNVWVAEGYHVIRKITPASVVTTFAGTNRGLEDGVG